MRFFGRTFILLLMLAVGWHAASYWQVLPWRTHVQLGKSLLENAQPRTVYVLDETKWLEFPLSGKGGVITLLFNASVRQQASRQVDTVGKYAIEYQVINSDGQVLEESIYHHRARVSFYLDKQNNRELTRLFYLNTPNVPSDSGVTLINTSGFNRLALLRVRLAGSDPEIVDAVVRLYEADPVAEHKLATAWHRLSNKQRGSIARGSAYGHELLREAEKRNLLLNRSKPAGPKGVRGKDYLDRKLYVINNKEDPLISIEAESTRPAGLFVDRWLRGVLPIPEGGAELTLQFLPTENHTLNADGESVYLHWYGRGPGKRAVNQVILSPSTMDFKGQFDGGLLEIKASVPLVVRATSHENGNNNEVSGASFYLRAYETRLDAPVEFSVQHVANGATPLRIDVRSFASRTDNPSGESVRYELLNSHGRVVKAGLLAVDNTPSVYDRFSLDTAALRLSEPARYYFAIPSNVSAIRLYSNTPTLVTAYTRPIDLERHLRVPEDYYFSRDDDKRQPAWFLVRPANSAVLMTEHRSHSINIQRRPPKVSSDIASGQYRWESYEPEGPWLGRHLLTPKQENAPLRKEALASTFVELSLHRPSPITFQALKGFSRIRPSLIFVRNVRAPARTEVTFNGEVLFSGLVAGSRGEIRLPPIPPGTGTLNVSSNESGKWFINHAMGNAPAYIKRLSYRIPSDGLTFNYLKRDLEEVLSAQLFSTNDEHHRVRLHVRIERHAQQEIGPFKTWSFTDRVVDARTNHNNDQPVPVLNTHNEFVSKGAPFFLPLGSDLSPGSYRIHLEIDSGPESYLTLYRIVPGEFDSRAFFTERFFGDDA